MKGYARAVATTAGLAIALTACGLAARSTAVLAPEIPAAATTADQHRSAEVSLAVSASEPVVIQKVVLPPEPAVIPKTTAAAANVGPMKHVWQSLNNCGPAAVVMALSTFGVDADQETARLALRGPDVRRGMGPGPVDPWVRDLYGLRSTWRNNGTSALIKALVSNGFAPMVTQWMQDPSISRIAHWRTVAGYDDAQGAFFVNDPMLGRGVPLSYEWFDRNWQPFSYRYMVIYKPADEPLLRAILAGEWSERVNRQAYADRARREALDRNDAASWLAYGEAAYQNGQFTDAVAAFEKGLSLGSAEGVFTLRSSYPQALRAVGRDQDASRAAAQLGVSAAPPTVAAPPDTVAIQIFLERARLQGIEITEQR